MCLYPRLIKNPKYKPNSKNGGNVPKVKDKRALIVPVGCGKCMECRKQKAREWAVRLFEDIKVNKNGKFCTWTFDHDSLINLEKEFPNLKGYDLDNAVATLAVRRYLERWRKKYKKSLRHWIITELGQTNTERIHLHGIVWTDNVEDIGKIWKYGHTYIGEYVNEKTISYITKYVNKADPLHKEYQSKILTSAGIGKNYIGTKAERLNKYKDENTRTYYKAPNGSKLALPIYYRNKIYSDDEREKLWMQLLDEEVRYVNGIKVDVSKGNDEYFKVLDYQRKLNKRLGFGSNAQNWERRLYEEERKALNKGVRFGKKGKKLISEPTEVGSNAIDKKQARVTVSLKDLTDNNWW